MSNSTIRFGTDGWRAIIAEDYTFENVRACAEGVARFLKTVGLADRGLVIGYDTRFASENFAAACAEVVAAHGIKTHLFGVSAATPIACHAVLELQHPGEEVRRLEAAHTRRLCSARTARQISCARVPSAVPWTDR